MEKKATKPGEKKPQMEDLISDEQLRTEIMFGYPFTETEIKSFESAINFLYFWTKLR